MIVCRDGSKRGRGALVKSEEYPHLGGNKDGGDENTWEPELWGWLVHTYNVRTVLDVGCGQGRALQWFQNYHCEALGIEGLWYNAAKAPFPTIEHDFTKSALYVPNVDLVWCCEVAEHIEERYVWNFLSTICVGKHVAITHGVPGQQGYHHVNNQPQEYWVERVGLLGYTMNDEATEKAREIATGFFKKTGLVFERQL